METWNGLSIEIQIRSQLQHAWATAVETVGLFTSQALKSSQGDAEWLNFFRTMSSEIAILEDSPVVPDTSTDPRVIREMLRRHDQSLDVLSRLETYAATLQFTESELSDARFILLSLDVRGKRVTATGYRSQEAATEAYARREEASTNDTDVVLVSVNRIASLRNAYPNYFLDTARFADLLSSALARCRRSRVVTGSNLNPPGTFNLECSVGRRTRRITNLTFRLHIHGSRPSRQSGMISRTLSREPRATQLAIDNRPVL